MLSFFQFLSFPIFCHKLDNFYKWNFDENVACDVPYTLQPCITLTRTLWCKSIALKKSNKIMRVFYSEWSHIVCLTWLCLACIWCMFYYLSWEKAPCPVLSKQQQLWCHLVGETELTGNWKEKFVNYKCRELPSCPVRGLLAAPFLLHI